MPAPYLKIGGDLVEDAILSFVEVRQELNHHWWCTVECRQTEDKRFPAESCLGQDLQIFTYDDKGAENVVFDGFVLDVELTYEIWGSYTARLTGVTQSYKMDLTPRQMYFEGSTLSDVASTLAGLSGLEISVNVPAMDPLNYVQWGESDFRFVNRLADDYTAWTRPSTGGLEVFNTFQDGTTLQWREEDGLLRFKSKGTLAQPAFNGAHYDFQLMQSQTYSGVSAAPSFYDSLGEMVGAVQAQSQALPPGYVFQRSRVPTLDDYSQLLAKESVRAIGRSIVGYGESRNQLLKAGNTVTIDGTLDAQGTYGVIQVVHRWTSTGYLNEFVCTPWQNYTNPEPPPLRAWHGLVSARVVDQADPKLMGRVQVQYIWQEDTVTHWARMMTPHSGYDRGQMFMPEVGDEVVVAFEDGDPERPVIIGCLWNGVDQAPREEFWGGDIEPNNVKRIVTKSGHRFQMIDQPGKESIVLATPKYLKVSLIETTDETGRSMITLHSENGDIFLSAPNGRVHVHSRHFSREVG
jgi:type VI secretion system secreted protein VgrG